MPPDSSIGFAPADWALFIVTALLLLAAYAWRPGVQRAFESLAQKPCTCAVALCLLPIVMRLLLLPHHPVPTPDIYDEFSQLLVADTLLHGRLANPTHVMHRFFETFFVLQQPTYSSMYPLGQGFMLALGRLISGIPWTGVLIATGAFCAACYWMLRGWVTPSWALLGGILAVMEFGPLCQWTNSYWGGGSLAAAAGCVVFGTLPRICNYGRPRDCFLLGAGFGVHMLTRQFETVFLLLAVVLFFVLNRYGRNVLRVAGFAGLPLIPVVLVILLQNHAVTHSWTTLPERLHQYQYGIPISLTIQPLPAPHAPLTAQQETDYRAESLQHGSGTDTIEKFLLRLEYRVRYYRFFFLPPLYLTLFSFCFALREVQWRWVAATLAIFALGTNLFPYLMLHYLAAVAGLFVLVSVVGLQQFSRLRIRDAAVGVEIAQVLIVLCMGEFLGWYGLHLFESPSLYSILRYETWDSINHQNPQRRIDVRERLAAISGQLLVFVRYSPRHIYQDEWVWNSADIDGSRIVYARDLGPDEDAELMRYYPKRRVLLLEPDGTVPQLTPYGEQAR
jgi:hypothetical protein